MIRYRPVKMLHPVAGCSYGIIGETRDENGRIVGNVIVPDISCDYLFVSRLAVKCTVDQLDPNRLLDVLCKYLP